MNTRTLSIAVLLGTVITVVLTNAPLIGLVNCLLCVGFWGGATIAVWYYKRQSGTLSLGQGIAIGALVGLCSGLIGFVLSFVGLSGAAGLVNVVAPLLNASDLASIKVELTGIYVVIFNLVGAVVTFLFGALGGLIGGALFKTRAPTA